MDAVINTLINWLSLTEAASTTTFAAAPATLSLVVLGLVGVSLLRRRMR